MRIIFGQRNAVIMGIACLLATAMAVPSAKAATISQITGFGSNPTGIGMYLYSPGTARWLIPHLPTPL